MTTNTTPDTMNNTTSDTPPPATTGQKRWYETSWYLIGAIVLTVLVSRLISIIDDDIELLSVVFITWLLVSLVPKSLRQLIDNKK